TRDTEAEEGKKYYGQNKMFPLDYLPRKRRRSLSIPSLFLLGYFLWLCSFLSLSRSSFSNSFYLDEFRNSSFKSSMFTFFCLCFTTLLFLFNISFIFYSISTHHFLSKASQ